MTTPRMLVHLRVIPILLALGWAAAPAAGAPPVEAPEYAIKAVFLYNLLKYAEWPALAARDDPSGPLIIAVVGEDPFGHVLQQAIQDRTIRGRRLTVIRISEVRNIRPCHLAFVGGSEPTRVAELVRVLTAQSVLVVGDSGEASRAGAAINLFMEQGKLRFDVNPVAVQRSRVELSSQVLKLARRIQEPGN